MPRSKILEDIDQLACSNAFFRDRYALEHIPTDDQFGQFAPGVTPSDQFGHVGLEATPAYQFVQLGMGVTSCY